MKTFDHIILNGRPGGGKSELIDFIRNTPVEKRRELFHIGNFVEEDDFVWIWEKFVEDDLWEALGEERIYSVPHQYGYVQKEDNRLLDLVAMKFNVAIQEKYRKQPGFYDDNTVFIEFARGAGDGGFRRVYEMLDDEILKSAAILYINVSYEESIRKNTARYVDEEKGSILAHRLPPESLERFSAEVDWEELSGGKDEGFITIRGIKIPFVSMPNEPELKSGPELDARYSKALTTLKRLAVGE